MDYNNPTAQNTRNGFFITAGILVVISSIILIGGDKSFFTSFYQLKVKFGHVQGLSVGSVVSLAGINVGNVEKIRFHNDEGKIEISLAIDEKFKSKITEGASATVKTQGALGDKYIYITPGSLDAPPIRSGEYLVADTRGDIFDIINEEGPKLAYVIEVINELKTLLANLNANNNSAVLMERLVKASGSINELSEESKELVHELRKAKLSKSLSSMNSILTKIDKGQGTLGALINDPSIHDEIINLIGKRPRNSYLKPLIRATIKSKDKKTN